MILSILSGPALLCLCTAAMVFGAHRWMLWLLPGPAPAPRAYPESPQTEHWLGVGLLAFLSVLWSVWILGHLGLLGPPGLGLWTAAWAATGWWASRSRVREIPGIWPREAALRIPLAATGVLVMANLAVRLPVVPVSWDAMTYHLYLPARWLQEGRLFHVPTVFGDNAAAFAPQNGALFFAWQMGLLGNDTLINVSQLPCLGLSMLALFALVRMLGIGAPAAVLAAATLPWLEPLTRWTWSANVDVFGVAFWSVGLYWIFAYRRRADASRDGRLVLLAGLAEGVALGTKLIALPLVAVTSLLIATRPWRPRHLGLYAAGLLGGGGFWYGQNAWRTGNPLFPLHLELGPLVFEGAYTAAAVRASDFRLTGLRPVLESLVHEWGGPAAVWTALGVLLLAIWARARRLAPPAWLAAGALAWLLYFLLWIPYNDEPRYLLPTVWVACAGWAWAWAWLGKRLGGRAPVLAVASWGVVIVALATSPPPWELWRKILVVMQAAEAPLPAWFASCAVVLALGAAGLGLPRRLRPLRWLAVASIPALLGLASLYAVQARVAFLSAANFSAWAPGYVSFNRPRVPPTRIAYSGANIPYALMGSGLRHRVVYLNTQGSQGDSFFDFWRRQPRQYTFHKPGLYRGRDDVESWLVHLAQERVEMVVVFPVHESEAAYIQTTADGFPVEARWMEERPARFEPVLVHPAARVYRVIGS